MLVRAIRFVIRSLWVRLDPFGYARRIGVRLGEGCYLFGITSDTFGSEPYLVKIGNKCVIAHGVDFITHDGGVWQFRETYPDIDVFDPIIIGDNVFVGAHSVFLPGTVIGNNCIIGAGSVLRGRFAPFTLIAGNPARPVGTVEGYWEKLKDKTVPAFFLKPHEKRAYLLDRFASILKTPTGVRAPSQTQCGNEATRATEVRAGKLK